MPRIGTHLTLSAVGRLTLLILLLGAGNGAQAHGNVALEDDLCLIKIGFYSAHFKIYLPRAKGHREYCEDLPEVGETVFVMEYSHGDLGQVPVDFRVIRNVTGMGRFTQLQDVEAIQDLDEVTEFYRPPVRSPEVYSVLHEFAEAGDYLGIVTARHPQTQALYTAVFPFEVGYGGYGYVPLFLLLAALGQYLYWRMKRGKRRG